MRHRAAQISFSTIIIIGVIIGLALTVEAVSFIKNRDADFCRRALYYLVKGRPAAEKMIDWNQLKAVGLDTGKEYSGLPNDNERKMFRKVFINSFAAGFLKVKGEFKKFVHWRVIDRKSDFIIVAADYKKTGDTLLFALPKKGKKKIQSIQWKEKE